jgi:hypothetical protein
MADGKGPRVSARETVPHRRHHLFYRYFKLYLKGMLALMGVGLFEYLTVAAAVEIGDNGKVPPGAISSAGTSSTYLLVVGQIIVLIVLPSVHRRRRPKDWKCGDYGDREEDFPAWMARAAAALFALIPLSLQNGCGLASNPGQCLAQPFRGEGWTAAVFPAVVGVAILMPIYKSIAGAFWRYDIRHVLRAPAASMRNVRSTLWVFAAPVVAARRAQAQKRGSEPATPTATRIPPSSSPSNEQWWKQPGLRS